jgi:hypothetical protein
LGNHSLKPKKLLGDPLIDLLPCHILSNFAPCRIRSDPLVVKGLPFCQRCHPIEDEKPQTNCNRKQRLANNPGKHNGHLVGCSSRPIGSTLSERDYQYVSQQGQDHES